MTQLPNPIFAPSEGRPTLSASQLDSWTTCGERYRLERVEKMPQGVSVWNIGGHAVHRVYQDVVDEGLNSGEAAIRFIEHFDAQVAEAELIEPDRSLWRRGGRVSKAWPEKESLDWWVENGTVMATKFATVYDTPFLPGQVVEHQGRKLTEVAFEIEIAGHVVRGVIDAIVELDGRFIPRDYKAGSRTPTSAVQLATYAEAIRQIYNVQPSTGQYLMARTMTAVDRDLAPLGTAMLERLYENLAKAKEHSIYLPNSGPLCGACAVAHACSFAPPGKENA